MDHSRKGFKQYFAILVFSQYLHTVKIQENVRKIAQKRQEAAQRDLCHVFMQEIVNLQLKAQNKLLKICRVLVFSAEENLSHSLSPARENARI